jgi:hypothetical protein
MLKNLRKWYGTRELLDFTTQNSLKSILGENNWKMAERFKNVVWGQDLPSSQLLDLEAAADAGPGYERIAETHDDDTK